MSTYYWFLSKLIPNFINLIAWLCVFWTLQIEIDSQTNVIVFSYCKNTIDRLRLLIKHCKFAGLLSR